MTSMPLVHTVNDLLFEVANWNGTKDLSPSVSIVGTKSQSLSRYGGQLQFRNFVSAQARPGQCSYPFVRS